MDFRKNIAKKQATHASEMIAFFIHKNYKTGTDEHYIYVTNCSHSDHTYHPNDGLIGWGLTSHELFPHENEMHQTHLAPKKRYTALDTTT